MATRRWRAARSGLCNAYVRPHAAAGGELFGIVIAIQQKTGGNLLNPRQPLHRAAFAQSWPRRSRRFDRKPKPPPCIIGALPVSSAGLVVPHPPDYHRCAVHRSPMGILILLGPRSSDVDRHLRHAKDDQLQILSRERPIQSRRHLTDPMNIAMLLLAAGACFRRDSHAVAAPR